MREWSRPVLEGVGVTVTHGSPWCHDSFVPILFAGHRVTPQRVSRRVHAVDVALTLSNVVRTPPRSGASGKVLLQVLGQ